MIGGKIKAAVLSVAVFAFLGLGGLYLWEKRQNARLEALNASLTRSVAVLEDSVAQAREAVDVLQAHLDRQAALAAEFEAIRDKLREMDNAPVSDEFCAVLADLGVGLCPDD